MSEDDEEWGEGGEEYYPNFILDQYPRVTLAFVVETYQPE